MNGIVFEPQSIDFLSRIATTILCGGVIGLERQLRGKAAGIRTSILICLGTAVFVSLGASLTGKTLDPTRVIGQVVTGIGFIGAGVIMATEGKVIGVTSAATIWVLASIGAVIGLDRLPMAMALTVVTVGVLVGVEFLETTFQKLRRGVHSRYSKETSKTEE